MAFTDLAAFRLSITTWLDVGSNISNSQLDDLITVSENKVAKSLRVRQMETALAATLGSTGTAAVPTDYIEAKFAYMNQGANNVVRLERKPASWIYEKYPDRTTSGTEQFFARDGSNFIFGERGTQGRIMTGSYYAKPTAMSSTINSVFSAYPEVYLFAALSESEPFIGRDQRVPMWESKYQQMLRLANQSDKDEYFSGSPLSATTS